jgi:hypothetical protein
VQMCCSMIVVMCLKQSIIHVDPIITHSQLFKVYGLGLGDLLLFFQSFFILMDIFFWGLFRLYVTWRGNYIAVVVDLP